MNQLTQDQPARDVVGAATDDPAIQGVRAALRAENVTLAYGKRVVAERADLTIPAGSFTVIIGPNACGKSTILRALSKLLTPSTGHVLLNGRDLQSLPAKQLARDLGLLAQTAVAPDGITVADLVSRGRYPHQSTFSRWTRLDHAAVHHALEVTQMLDLAPRPIDELSGGQRQRAWVAMALAQETTTLLLDEPTTFLDIAHQIQLLDLFAELHQQGRTIVAVLHDINHAARYATHLVVMSGGDVIASGPPETVITPTLIREVFGIESVVIDDPLNGGPLVVPRHGTQTPHPSEPHTPHLQER